MLPRGIRNNNPLNIKIGNDWKGEVPNTDGTFEQFESMEYGLRAELLSSSTNTSVNMDETHCVKLSIHGRRMVKKRRMLICRAFPSGVVMVLTKLYDGRTGT